MRITATIAILTLCLSSQASEFFPGKGSVSTLVVFVHGLMGDSKTTWLNTTSSMYWPQVLSQDEDLQGVDTYSFGYNAECDNLSPEEAAKQLKIDLDEYLKKKRYKKLLFVGHSLGGLVVREFIYLFGKELEDRIDAIFLLAAPNLGNNLAKPLLKLWCSDRYISLLDTGRGSYIDGLNSRWRETFEQRSSKKTFNFYAGYEVVPEPAIGIVVEKDAAVLYAQQVAAFSESHRSIAKPESRDARVYKWLKNYLQRKSTKQAALTPGQEVRFQKFFALTKKKMNEKGYNNLLESMVGQRALSPLGFGDNKALYNFATAVAAEREGNSTSAMNSYYEVWNNGGYVNLGKSGFLESGAAIAVKKGAAKGMEIDMLAADLVGDKKIKDLKGLIKSDPTEWHEYLRAQRAVEK